MRARFLLFVIIQIISTSKVIAETYSNSSFSQRMLDNSRWSIDLASQLTHNQDTDNNILMHAVGLDFHKVFSSNSYDIGTLTFQPYIVKLNNGANASSTYNNDNSTELTWRITNFNYTALSQGRFNIRLGHFEIPFGLEYQIDTNGTLRQLTYQDRGIKADWGVSLNGILPQLEYEVALTRGSGNDIKDNHDPYIFSGRIGTPSHKNFVGGFSWFTGEVLHNNNTIKHEKIAIDASYYYYQWQFMFETSIGTTSGKDTVNTFSEVLWKNPTESLKTYIQLGHQRNEVIDDVDSRNVSTSYWLAGIQWVNDSGLDVSAQYKNSLKDAPTNEIPPILSIQLRYRL